LDYPPKKKKENKKKGENDIESATQTVFRFLSYRNRSVEEVKRKLQEKGFPPYTINKTLARVKELGYLNDHEYAYAFACAAVENKQWGTLRIHDVLAHKGIPQEIINNTIAKINKEYDIKKVARSALETRFIQFRSPQQADKKSRKKAADFLKRKGFTWDTIVSVITNTQDT
jgi:regulatory protein